jgi:chromosome segregation ATPase
VRETTEHRSVSAQLSAAREELEKARASGKGTDAQIATLVDKTQGLTNQAAAIENRALGDDEGYRKASTRLKEASADLAEVKRRLDERIRVDEERIAAVAAIDSSKKEASATDKDLAAARKQAAAAHSVLASAQGACETIRKRVRLNEGLLRDYESRLR